MSKQEDLQGQLDSIIDEFEISGDEKYTRLLNEAIKIQYELGRASVYNENGWEYFKD